jgi:predicted phage tail protein
MLSHRFKAALGAITTVGLLGLFAVPGEVHAAITVTITDSSGAAVGGAFVAVLNSDGDAVDSAITAKDGRIDKIEIVLCECVWRTGAHHRRRR